MPLRRMRADLHIHTCLSPCGELEMTPVHIVERCRELGLGIIAVCDHNSAKNVAGVVGAAAGGPPAVLCGMEVTTSEEVHILAVFDTPGQALELQQEVYAHLLPGENNDELFGMQVVANALDEVDGFEHRLLIGGTTLALEQAVETIHRLNGLAIASHIDRQSYSLIGQLGFIPEGLRLDAVEISRRGSLEEMRLFPGVSAYPAVRSSDAHTLADLGGAWTDVTVFDPSVAELKLALQGTRGRSAVPGVREI
ncbi:histidinol phosphatase [bacterium]|nr:histidinol phosphatase [bacterium]